MREDDGARSCSAAGRSTTSAPSGRLERVRALGWIAVVPGVLGTAIDHVLVDRGRFAVRAGAVVDVPGTDHRAVVVRVAQR